MFGFEFWNRKCITETKRAGRVWAKEKPKWIEIVDEFVGILRLFQRDRNTILVWFISSLGALLYWHDFTAKFTTTMKKIIKKKRKLNKRKKNKIFKHTKSWKPITVECEWNIVIENKFVSFVKKKMRIFAATAMTFYVTKKATCIDCLTLTFLFTDVAVRVHEFRRKKFPRAHAALWYCRRVKVSRSSV